MTTSRRHFSILIILTSLCWAYNYACGAVAITEPGNARAASAGTMGTFGYQFVVGPQSLSVAALGIWDSDEDGLVMAHQLALWDASGALLGSTTIPAGTSTTKIGEFRYQLLLAPIVLTAGETFTIGSSYVTADPDLLRTAVPPGPTFSADIQFPASRYFLGQFAFPTDSVGGSPYAGPNFQYVVVPEPSSICVLILGIVAFIKVRTSAAKLPYHQRIGKD